MVTPQITLLKPLLGLVCCSYFALIYGCCWLFILLPVNALSLAERYCVD